MPTRSNIDFRWRHTGTSCTRWRHGRIGPHSPSVHVTANSFRRPPTVQRRVGIWTIGHHCRRTIRRRLHMHSTSNTLLQTSGFGCQNEIMLFRDLKNQATVSYFGAFYVVFTFHFSELNIMYYLRYEIKVPLINSVWTINSVFGIPFIEVKISFYSVNFV